MLSSNFRKQTGFWATISNTPRLLRLVWAAAPGWLLLTLAVTITEALTPVAQLYVGKLIVDQVVRTASQALDESRDVGRGEPPAIHRPESGFPKGGGREFPPPEGASPSESEQSAPQPARPSLPPANLDTLPRNRQTALDSQKQLPPPRGRNLDLMPLVGLVGLGFSLMLLQGVLNRGKTYVSQVLSDRFMLHAGDVLLQQAIRLDLAHYEMPEFYDTLHRAQQNGNVYPLRSLTTLTTLTGQLVGFAGMLTLLLRFGPAIVVLLLLSSVPAFWVGVRYSNRRFWMLRHQTPAGRLGDYLQQVLTDQAFVKEVRLFNLGEHLLNQWRQIRGQFNQESQALAARQASAHIGIGFVSTLGFYGAYALVIWQAVRRTITVGDLTLYAGTFQQAQTAIQGILQSIADIYENNLYVSQYFEFLSLEPQVVNPSAPQSFPVPMQSGLVLRNVSFTYPGASEPTLRNLDLSVQPGECVALVGVNGAGKTTLLKLLARFYEIDSGEITIDGVPLSEFDLGELRHNIGVLFQDFARYALSVEDNVGFGDLRERGNQTRIQQAVVDAGATEIIAGLEQGYQTILGKIFSGGVELSGGQWQKIGLARAFMTSAQILILDEPTAAVDALAEYDLFQRFRQLTRDKMTFLVSHRFSTVRMADRIVVLDEGQIAEVGTHSELMAQCGLYAHMFRMQAASYQLDGQPDGSLDQSRPIVTKATR